MPSVREFVAMTSQLGKGGSTGMRFTVAGFPVDLIPFSAWGDLEQPLELGDGVLMDTTGMDEAFDARSATLRISWVSGTPRCMQ